MIKSLTARQIFQRIPLVKKKLWGGEYWKGVYFVATVSKHSTEEVIMCYVKEQLQGPEQYKQLHTQQLRLFGF